MKYNTNVIKSKLFIKIDTNNRDFESFEKAQKTIHENIKYIYLLLDLDNISNALTEVIEKSSEAFLSQHLSERERCCFYLCLENCKDNELERSYHELVDFLINYNNDIEKPFSEFEMAAIKIMIKNILFMLRYEDIKLKMDLVQKQGEILCVIPALLLYAVLYKILGWGSYKIMKIFFYSSFIIITVIIIIKFILLKVKLSKLMKL